MKRKGVSRHIEATEGWLTDEDLRGIENNVGAHAPKIKTMEQAMLNFF
jgi:hypothetical protein